MPKLIDHERRKLDLMRAAVSTCYDRGFSRLAIADIASAVGVSRTLFYAYFPDKSSIVDYALDYALEVVGRDYRRLCDNAFLSAPEKVYALFERILTDIVREKRTMTVFLQILVERSPETYRQRLRLYHWMYTIRRYLERILRTGIARGELRPVKVDPMAVTLLMLLLTAMHTLTISERPIGRQILDSVAVLLQGLVPRETRDEDMETTARTGGKSGEGN